jgi:hypothetical protein
VLAEKTFIGQRLGLEHYKGISIIDYAVEVLDEDGDPYPFTDFVSIHFEIFAKAHGKSLSNTELDVPDDNTINVNVDVSNLNLRPSYYFYECYGLSNDSPAEKVIFHYGVFEII